MALTMRVLTKFPALVTAATGLAVERAGRTYNFLMDWLSIAEVDAIADPSSRYIIVVSGTDSSDALYERIPLDDFQAAVAGLVQLITDPGPQDIENTAATVQVNQDTPAAITLVLPLSAGKVGPVKVIDWLGDAATNAITVELSGGETFQGGLTSWLINGDGASAVFNPIPGVGYAV